MTLTETKEYAHSLKYLAGLLEGTTTAVSKERQNTQVLATEVERLQKELEERDLRVSELTSELDAAGEANDELSSALEDERIVVAQMEKELDERESDDEEDDEE